MVTAQRRVSFLFPDGYMPTMEEHRQNLIQAENSESMTLSEYNERIDIWRRKNL